MFGLCAFAAATCMLLHSAGAQDYRIVNGTDAEEGEFPFAVSLRYNGGHLCGGTILNADHVLTAAHCVCVDSDPAWYAPLVTVQYGLLQITSDSFQAISVNDTICNEYDSSNWYINDVAILTLREPIPDEFLVPVILEDRQNTTLDNLDAVVIGWGRNATNGFLPDILQKGEVLVYNDTICAEAWYGLLDLFHHLCSGWPENGRGSCQGDSGGALLVEGGKVQIGIVSFGAGGNCGISNVTLPKVLARVPSYIDFIQEYAGEVQLASEYFGDGEDPEQPPEDPNDDDDDDGPPGEDPNDDDDDDDPPGEDPNDDDDDDDPPGEDPNDDDDNGNEDGGASVAVLKPAVVLLGVAVYCLMK